MVVPTTGVVVPTTTAPIGTPTAAETCRHGNTPWSAQIADLKVSFFVQDSQIGDLKRSKCITVQS